MRYPKDVSVLKRKIVNLTFKTSLQSLIRKEF